MSQVRRRKAAKALATRIADEFVAAHRDVLRDVNTIEGVERAIGGELRRARSEFDDCVIPERRVEKLLEQAVVAALERTPAKPRPLAPIVVESDVRTRGEADTELAYREAPPEPEIQLKPSRLVPPPSTLARLRPQLLFASVWIVAVIRFAPPVRAHGMTKLALMQGLLGTISVLPFVLGAILLVLPRR